MNLLLAAVLLMQEKTVEQLIEQLRSDKIEERQTAKARLQNIGEEARRLLEKAAKDDDKEVAHAAREILNALDVVVSEKAFQRIDEAIQKAVSLRVNFKGKGIEVRDGKDINFEISGVIQLKEGNKLHLSSNMIFLTGKPEELLAVSDGRKLMWRNDELTKEREELTENPAIAQGVLTQAINRIGPGHTCMLLRYALSLPEELEKSFGRFKLAQEFRGGESDGEAKTLQYKTVAKDLLVDVRLWYSPVTYTPLRRVIKLSGRVHSTFSETYEEFVLNADIPDEKFKLPEEKK